MNNRRDFLKTVAAGAVLLSSNSKMGVAATLDTHAENGKSKVVIARDPALHDASGQLDEKRVQALLDRAIASYTGRDKPVEAWKRIVPASLVSAGNVIGLKVNGLGGKGICTHRMLTLAIAERLQQIGVKAEDILVWDQRTGFLEACGFTIGVDSSHIRGNACDQAAFEENMVTWGVAQIKLSKILTRECAMVLNLPILNGGAGVTFSMKNMYGVIDHPQTLHAGNCNPGVADLNCIPAIREKVRFTIGDAMTSVYDGGPGFHPERLWQPNALIVGEDRVAVDHTAWQMIERKRAEVGMETLEAAGRPPRYIVTAADKAHNLGTNDPQRIHLLEV
jgi:hypothetical protein